MDIIKTGLGITKTFKNVSRMQEIVAVLSRNGFDEFIIKTGLHKKIPNFVLPKSRHRISQSLQEYTQASWAESLGYRLRKAFEELGPSFIKIGQLLATREDIFPEGFILEMRKLQDQVPGIPFSKAKEVIESSLKKNIDDVFSEIQEDPIGTASIGIVYQGKLKNGEQVVIKVRRPNIVKNLETDFSILHFIISQIEKVSQEVKYLSISKILHDFASYLTTELNFRIEALNCERLAENISRLDEENIFHLPKVYKDLSTEEILIMEHIQGIPFSQTKKINEHKESIQKKLEHGIQIFVHNMLVDGFFHADLHGGNFFLMPNGKIAIIDFGLVGRLSQKNKTSLVAILYAMVNFNFEKLVYEFLEVAEYDEIPDLDELIHDVKDCLTPYMGLTVQQINVSVLFRSVMSTLAEHQLYLPREWFIVFRAMVTLDGVGKSLDIDFDIFKILSSDIQKIIAQLITKEGVLEDALWMSRDMINSLRSFPRHFRWFLKEFSKNNYGLQIVNTGYEKSFSAIAKTFRFLGFSFLSGILTFSGAYLMHNKAFDHPFDFPPLVWIFWSLAFVLFMTGFWGMRKSGD